MAGYRPANLSLRVPVKCCMQELRMLLIEIDDRHVKGAWFVFREVEKDTTNEKQEAVGVWYVVSGCVAVTLDTGSRTECGTVNQQPIWSHCR